MTKRMHFSLRVLHFHSRSRETFDRLISKNGRKRYASKNVDSNNRKGKAFSDKLCIDFASIKIYVLQVFY